jgi:hypothetical protein
MITAGLDGDYAEDLLRELDAANEENRAIAVQTARQWLIDECGLS